jgi:phycocyanobilin lyase beta subunit
MTLERIEAVERATTAQGLLAATAALADCGDPLAVTCLLQVLGFNNPGAAVAAVDGLIRIGEEAVEPLLRSLDTPNYGARAWVVRALAGIGDVRGLEVLIDALSTDIGPSVRRAAARGLGTLRLGDSDGEDRRQTLERCLAALQEGCEDGEWIVRYAVAVGMESLGLAMVETDEQRSRILRTMAGLASIPQEPTQVVRMRASLARSRLINHWGMG